MVIAGGSGVIKSLGYAWILAPAEFGRLGLVTSLAPFLVYGFGRGAIEGAALNLPRLYGQGRVNEASQLLRHCVKRLTFEGVLATGLSGLVFLADSRMAILCLAVPLASSTGLLSLAMTDARSRGAMNLYGSSVLARVAVCSVCGLPAAAIFGIKGAVLGEVGAQIVLIAWLLRYVEAPKTAMQAGSLFKIRAYGWNMMVHQFLQMLQQNGDRWLISAALGPVLLGQYSFAAIFLTAVSLLHAIIYQQIGPAALRSLAEGRPLHAVLRRSNQVAWAAGGGVALLGVFSGVGYWWGLTSIFSCYPTGFTIFPWIVLTGVFQIMNQHDWIIAAGRHMGTLASFDLLSTAIYLFLALLGWMVGWSLVYFVILTCWTRCAALLATMYLANLTARKIRI